MSVGSMWVMAKNDEGEAVLSEEAELPTLFLDGVGELELMALAIALAVPYEPELVLEAEGEGGMVMRIGEPLLRKLATIPEGAHGSVAASWCAAAGELDGRKDEIEALLEEMTDFAEEALDGPGVLSVPMF